MNKYIKPSSLTWWASAFPAVSGVVIALSEGVPSLGPVASVLRSMTGNVDPATLINLGLAGIGLRGAIDNN